MGRQQIRAPVESLYLDGAGNSSIIYSVWLTYGSIPADWLKIRGCSLPFDGPRTKLLREDVCQFVQESRNPSLCHEALDEKGDSPNHQTSPRWISARGGSLKRRAIRAGHGTRFSPVHLAGAGMPGMHPRELC